MRIGQELIVEPIWSVTGQSCSVILLNIDPKGPYLYVEYPGGYREWLPITSFVGY
jgi:hypothetical protein